MYAENSGLMVEEYFSFVDADAVTHGAPGADKLTAVFNYG